MMAEIHQHKHQTIQGYCKKQKPDLVSVLKPSIKDPVAEPEGKYVTQCSSSFLRYTGGRPLPNAWVYG